MRVPPDPTALLQMSEGWYLDIGVFLGDFQHLTQSLRSRLLAPGVEAVDPRAVIDLYREHESSRRISADLLLAQQAAAKHLEGVRSRCRLLQAMDALNNIATGQANGSSTAFTLESLLEGVWTLSGIERSLVDTMSTAVAGVNQLGDMDDTGYDEYEVEIPTSTIQGPRVETQVQDLLGKLLVENTIAVKRPIVRHLSDSEQEATEAREVADPVVIDTDTVEGVALVVMEPRGVFESIAAAIRREFLEYFRERRLDQDHILEHRIVERVRGFRADDGLLDSIAEAILERRSRANRRRATTLASIGYENVLGAVAVKLEAIHVGAVLSAVVEDYGVGQAIRDGLHPISARWRADIEKQDRLKAVGTASGAEPTASAEVGPAYSVSADDLLDRILPDYMALARERARAGDMCREPRSYSRGEGSTSPRDMIPECSRAGVDAEPTAVRDVAVDDAKVLALMRGVAYDKAKDVLPAVCLLVSGQSEKQDQVAAAVMVIDRSQSSDQLKAARLGLLLAATLGGDILRASVSALRNVLGTR